MLEFRHLVVMESKIDPHSWVNIPPIVLFSNYNTLFYNFFFLNIYFVH